MKKTYVLSLFVLAGFVLNFAFTVTPTRTEAVFGGPDNTDTFIQRQDNNPSFIDNSSGLDPLDANEYNEDISGLNYDSAVVEAANPFPDSQVAAAATGYKKVKVTYGGVSRSEYLPKKPEFKQNCVWGVATDTGTNVARFVGLAHGAYNAQDISVPTGTPVVSSCDGIVVLTQFDGYNGGFGINVVVDHGPFKTRYAHLSAIEVVVGQSVSLGEEIAKSGSTGNSTGPHLHFEVIPE